MKKRFMHLNATQLYPTGWLAAKPLLAASAVLSPRLFCMCRNVKRRAWNALSKRLFKKFVQKMLRNKLSEVEKDSAERARERSSKTRRLVCTEFRSKSLRDIFLPSDRSFYTAYTRHCGKRVNFVACQRVLFQCFDASSLIHSRSLLQAIGHLLETVETLENCEIEKLYIQKKWLVLLSSQTSPPEGAQ